MGKFRKIVFLMIFVYTAFAFAVNFHSHPQEKEFLTLHCKLCQLSQTSLEQVDHSELTPEPAQVGFCQPVSVHYSACGLVTHLQGRAPPLS